DEIELELSVVRVRGRGVHDRPALPPSPTTGEAAPVDRRRVHFRRGVAHTPSPARTRYEGTSTLRPLTVRCPWRTSWRASAREVANPSRYAMLSSRRS